ncbi:hypothetical protein IE980_29545 [Klebsiella pneumoniae]|uniref:Uncharacterized protein n=1 Tax=Klebsiella pneumoniae TaxID=573 RepID=A0A927E3Z8_KLEPN|nr:hypothetical protein [Klebsiella pneumoniae]
MTASSNMLTLKDRDGVRLDLKVSAVDSQWTLFGQRHCRWQRGASGGAREDTGHTPEGRGKHHGDESGGRAADGTAAGAENHADRPWARACLTVLKSATAGWKVPAGRLARRQRSLRR